MTNIDYRDGLAIGEIIVYVPALVIAVVLAIRHGFGRSSGWLFLIIFALARIIGSCMQLATINDPTNVSLFTGVAILQTIGLSPLELASLGLLSRIIDSINRSRSTLIQHYHVKLIQTFVVVALILSIIGGINASNTLTTTGKYSPQGLSQAAMGLFIASFVLVVIITIVLSFSVSHAEHGEKRLLLAVALSLPFLLVRLIYAAISIFANLADFNPLTGSATIYLCMALIMEFCVVVIYEAVGLTLRRLAKLHAAAPATISTGQVMADGTYGEQAGPQSQSKASQVASTLGRHTIIGRLVTSSAGRGRTGDDVEMQARHGRGGGYSRQEARRARRHQRGGL